MTANSAPLPPGMVAIASVLATRDRDHIREIEQALREAKIDFEHKFAQRLAGQRWITPPP